MSQRNWRVVLLTLVICGPRPIQAATQAQIDQAVQRGGQFLVSTQAADGRWSYGGHDPGCTALAALALLESGAKPSDPAIQRAAYYVRANAVSCTQTYDISLMVFFLDRLGDKKDVPIIVGLGERLCHGQNAGGAWSYHCPLSAANRPAGGGGFGGDNSNTQFAILALWVARRHGVDVQAALQNTDKYFRGSQGRDGGWNYMALGGADAGRALPPGMPLISTSTGSMTCAGLLGLLVQIGNQAALRAGSIKDLEARSDGKHNTPAIVDPLKDPAVQAGFKCLGQFLMPGANLNRTGLGTELYFLWSVERVAVAYGLEKIGPIDWYAAGADRIVASQQPDGSWRDHAPNVGTSLALLFLRRANVASDLTRIVAGESALRSSDDPSELQNVARGTSSSPRPSRDTPLSDAKLGALTPERLKGALSSANEKQQTAILEELRDRKGSEATLALAEAIANLDGAIEERARDYLIQRLERMTPATLARYLEYDDDEIRLAAAKAAQTRPDPVLIDPLVGLLESRDTAAADAAHAALVKQTGQQFGAFAGQSTVNRFVVIKKWKSWRDAQKK